MLLFLADIILVLHALFVAFVILGLGAILLGRFRRWAWVRNWWFRIIHLVAIGFVMTEAWLGLICPLTEWENQLRIVAGLHAYSEPFFQHWLREILFYDFPTWVFTLAYTAFAVLVLIVWLLLPPDRRK